VRRPRCDRVSAIRGGAREGGGGGTAREEELWRREIARELRDCARDARAASEESARD
jgi:hypothetical protein